MLVLITNRYEVTHMDLISLIYIRCVDRLGNAGLAQQRALSEFNLDKQVYHTRNDYRCQSGFCLTDSRVKGPRMIDRNIILRQKRH